MAVDKAAILGLLLVAILADVEGCGWTQWLDRDNAGGVGDWETYDDFATPPCGSGYPVILQARRVGTKLTTLSVDAKGIVRVTGLPLNDHVSYSAAKGLWCTNSQQNDNTCDDYEVRFYCILNP